MNYSSFIRALYLYARCSASHRSELEDLRDACFAKIVENGGQEVASTSGNGLAVTFNTSNSSMNYNTLFECCVEALEMLDNRKVSKIRGSL